MSVYFLLRVVFLVGVFCLKSVRLLSVAMFVMHEMAINLYN